MEDIKKEAGIRLKKAREAILERVRMCQAFSAGRATLTANGDLHDNIGTISLVSYVGTVDPHYLIVIDVQQIQNGTRISAVSAHGPLGDYGTRLKYWAEGGLDCSPATAKNTP